MTTTMTKKIEEAKKMVAYFVEHKLIDGGANRFTPTEYDEMRWQWEGETPAWSTLKKYATEAGLTSEVVAIEWHSDGSALAEMCGIADGAIFYHTFYRLG